MSAEKFAKNRKTIGLIALSAVSAILLLLAAYNIPGKPHQAGFTYTAADHSLEMDLRPNFHQLDADVAAYFAGKDTSYSFYFEYLPTGTSVTDSKTGAEEEAASLMKLPLVMDAYRSVEMHSAQLDEKLTVEPDWLDDRYGDLWKKGAGTDITLRQAINLTLIKSDNTALNAVKHATKLSAEESSTAAVSAYTGTGPVDMSHIDAESYSKYFRCLYFSCFLSRANSEDILTQLGQTKFNGITAGLPSDIKVAHKIGVSPTTHNDCGIVYYPGHPYILCMMLRLPRDEYEKPLADVSKIVYTDVETALNNAKIDQ